MINHLPDTNVFSQIFRNNFDVQSFVENLNSMICSTVYIECLQGSKSNQEKSKIKKYLETFSIFYQTENISRQAIALIDRYSNTHGLLLGDAQIAATCLEYDLVLITYNVKDFQFIADLTIAVPPFPTI
jgi:predicted nucleic acid-binding protein